MDSAIGKSLLVVVSLQTAIAVTALSSSPEAAIAAAAIGALAIARYGSVSFFAASLGTGDKLGLRTLAGSAWVIGLMALGAAIAAVAVKARPALPWAVAAAVAGPIGMSALAFGTGLGELASARPRRLGGKR
jgi:hypothetical protein